MKGRDYDKDPDAHLGAVDTHIRMKVDPGAHVGPPVKKRQRRCGSTVRVWHSPIFENLPISCEEAFDHSGSHYGVSMSGEYDMSWNGPDELKDGIYN